MVVHTDVGEPGDEGAVECCAPWWYVKSEMRSVAGAVGGTTVSSTGARSGPVGWVWIGYAYEPEVDADDAAMCWTDVGGPDADVYYCAYAVVG